MHRVTTSRFFTGLFALLMLCATLPALVQAAPSPTSDPRSLPLLAEDASVQDLNEQLDLIRQKVSGSANDDMLSTLRQAALQVQKKADTLAAKQALDLEHLDDQLNVLGPLQADAPPSLTQQRTALTRQKNALLAEQRQASTLSQSASDLAAQIFSLRRSLFDSQISTRSASPISVVFWSNIIRPTDDDLSRLRSLYVDARSVTDTAVAPGNRWFFVSMLLSALLVWVAGRRVLEHALVRLTVRWLPKAACGAARWRWRWVWPAC